MVSRPPTVASLDRPWIRAYPPGVPPTYRIPSIPLTRLLDDAVRDFPDRTALQAGNVTLAHAELRDRVAEVVAACRTRGVGAGDRVLVATGTTATTAVLLLALWRLGAVVVPLPSGRDRDRAAARATEVAVATGVSGVIAPPERLEELVVAGLETDWTVEAGDDAWLAPRRRLRPRPRRRRRRAIGDPPALADLVSEVGAAPVTVHAAGPVAGNAPAMLVPRWRGGQMRAIVLTHGNLVASTFQARLWVPDIQAGREQVVVVGDLLGLGPLVLGWLAGLLAGATVELVPPDRSAGLARLVARNGATIAVLEPPHVAAMFEGDTGRRDLSTLRVVLAAGAALDPELAADLERRTGGARVREGFGVSEAGPITHAQPVYGRTTPGAMGLPVTSTVAAVVDPDDLARRCPPGVPGRLLLAGPQVSPGYHEDPEATAERFVDGWLVTDDLVTVDEDGVFTHLGRRDELLTTSTGDLVSPRRVEAVLERHAEVSHAGVTTDDTGALVAAVRTVRRSRVDVEELLTHCHAHLESRDVPTRVTMVEDIPETAAGEVARDELREQLAER